MNCYRRGGALNAARGGQWTTTSKHRRGHQCSALTRASTTGKDEASETSNEHYKRRSSQSFRAQKSPSWTGRRRATRLSQRKERDARSRAYKTVIPTNGKRDEPYLPITTRTETEDNRNKSNQALTQKTGKALASAFHSATLENKEVVPYGVQAVWGGENASARGRTGEGCYAFIIDTGISTETDDLDIKKEWSKSWIDGEDAFDDAQGHGTHVAGIIGAQANGRGIIGVAPGATLVSLKVFDKNGAGASYAKIIEAIRHATQIISSNALDLQKTVINLSLGGGKNEALNKAMLNAAEQGVRLTVAAGNDGDDVDRYSPASTGKHKNIYTVSAIDRTNTMPSWSNWDDQKNGDDVDFAAPGVDIYSYYKDGKLAKLSGTSMAAPHVAGLLLTGGVRKGLDAKPSLNGQTDPQAISQSVKLRKDETDKTGSRQLAAKRYGAIKIYNNSIMISSGAGSISRGRLENATGLREGTLNGSLNKTKKRGKGIEGSAIEIDLDCEVGDQINIIYEFESTDVAPFSDFAYYSVNGEAYNIAAVSKGEKNMKTGIVVHSTTRDDLHKGNGDGIKLTIGSVDTLDRDYDCAISIKQINVTQNGDSSQKKQVKGSAGDDILRGGTSGSLFYSGPGNDLLIGGSGVDSARFTRMSNTIDLRKNTKQDTGDGLDTLISIEQIRAGGGDDQISGNSKNNVLRGGYGDDVLLGRHGDDRLIGGPGMDTLRGGHGNDFIKGGAGINRVWGGPGRDTFQLERGEGYSIIEDFGNGEDHLIVAMPGPPVSQVAKDGSLVFFQGGDLVAVIKDRYTQLQSNGAYFF